MGHFLFRFNSREERDQILYQSPIFLQKKRLHLLSWSPGQGPFEWPPLHSIWIRISRIPYHYWSSNILRSIASAIGHPIKLDDISASQKILTYARILVNLDLSKHKPSEIRVKLEGESEFLLFISYEYLPCPKCLSPSHPESLCNSSKTPSNSNTIPPEIQGQEGILGKLPNTSA